MFPVGCNDKENRAATGIDQDKHTDKSIILKGNTNGNSNNGEQLRCLIATKVPMVGGGET